jgi:predicted CXXCH cytochrome family protein
MIENRMNRRNTITLSFMLMAFCSLLYALSLEAAITGQCSNCHTMHNSQNGTTVVSEGPQPFLLNRVGCLGCHSSTNGATWKESITGTPIVFNTVAPTYGANGLAGGNFYYVNSDDTYGHNVLGIKGLDTTLGLTPPGGTALTAQLRCAGTWGCHGHNGRQTGDTAVDDQALAIKGAHHGNDTPPLLGSLTNIAANYRFLLGIKGKEDTDWEHDVVNTSHNEYQGATDFTTTNTISYLCGECHGDYHSATGVCRAGGCSSPWLRHPTDIVLPSNVNKEYTQYTTYSMVAPIARPDPDNVSNTTVVTPGIDIVMCLSCHRAHASLYFKIMRWDYKGWPAGGTNGCGICHASKK